MKRQLPTSVYLYALAVITVLVAIPLVVVETSRLLVLFTGVWLLLVSVSMWYFARLLRSMGD